MSLVWWPQKNTSTTTSTSTYTSTTNNNNDNDNDTTTTNDNNYGLVVPSHYLNQCWNIVHWISRNKLQWNFNRNSWIFIRKSIRNIACEMAPIFSRPRVCQGFMRPFCFGLNQLMKWSRRGVIKGFHLIPMFYNMCFHPTHIVIVFRDI